MANVTQVQIPDQMLDKIKKCIKKNIILSEKSREGYERLSLSIDTLIQELSHVTNSEKIPEPV